MTDGNQRLGAGGEFMVDGLMEHIRDQYHLRVFFIVVTGRGIRPHLPASKHAMLAQQIVELGARRTMTCYGRRIAVGLDGASERGSIDNQRDFLRKFTQLYQMTDPGEYCNDGVSGTLPLQERPAGRRLPEAAAD